MYSKRNSQVKRQLARWERIFSSNSSKRELISKIHKELKKKTQINKKTTQSNQNMSHASKQRASKEDMQMANKYF